MGASQQALLWARTRNTPQPTFSNVKLLLHGSAYPFIDASLNKRAVALVGPTTGSNSINIDNSNTLFGNGTLKILGLGGSTVRLQCNPSADWAMGTGAFMMDCWVYRTTGGIVRIAETDPNAALGFQFSVSGTGEVALGYNSTFYGTTGELATVPTLTWTHVAISYDGTTLRTFVGGVLATATVVALNISLATTALVIGNNYQLVNGNSQTISDLRIVKGEAVYTAAFDAPIAVCPDTGIVIEAAPTATFANVKALLHMDGTDASTTFTDVIGKTWTAQGNAQLDTAQFLFGTASGLFDGTGDYVTCGSSSDFYFGAGEFVFEFAFRPATTYNSGTSQKAIVGQWVAASNNSWMVDYNLGNLRFLVTNNVTTYVATITKDLAANTWYRITAVRSGDYLYLFLDGVLQAILAMSAGFTLANMTGTTAASIGAKSDGTVPCDGWIDEFRVVKGESVYPRSFILPASAFPDS
jgi:hypothetical protein